MLKKFAAAAILLTITAFLAGCGPRRPDFLPDTFPTTVTVVDGGSPVEGVTVTLFRAEALPNVTVYGVTDSSGATKIASMAGGNNFDGAPAGEYTVICNKKITEAIPNEILVTPGDSPAEIKKKGEAMKAFKDEHRVVPEILEKQATSPIQLTVGDKGELKIDLAEHK